MQDKNGYRIASFNIEKFGSRSVEFFNGQSSRKDLAAIADIINDNQIDILAIQEISHQSALKSLIEALSLQTATEIRPPRKSNLTRDTYGYSTPRWEGRWAKPASSYSDRAAEGYAFIWNRDRIQLVTNYEDESFEPRIGFYLRNGEMVRAPFIGRFMPIKSRCEFRVINAHLAWEQPANFKQEGDEEGNDTQSKAIREQELELLLDAVYPRLAYKQYDVNNEDRHARPLVPYTFLLGDYNLNLPERGSGAKMSSRLQEYICGNLRIVTVNGELTTLKRVPKDPEKAKAFRADPNFEHHLANNYDHFSYDKTRILDHHIADPTTAVIAAYEIYQSADSDYQEKFDVYKNKVSDHLPIILDIDILNKR